MFVRSVRICLEKCEVFDRVGSCKEIFRRNVRYLFVLGVVRILFENGEVSIELVVVRRMLGEMQGI